MQIEEPPNTQDKKQLEKVLEAKELMLNWPNPVEYVNNMYGCHPRETEDEEQEDYFQAIFGGLENGKIQ